MMKIYHLPAAFYGVASSSSLYHHHWRCSALALRHVATKTTARHFRSSSSSSPSPVRHHRNYMPPLHYAVDNKMNTYNTQQRRRKSAQSIFLNNTGRDHRGNTRTTYCTTTVAASVAGDESSTDTTSNTEVNRLSPTFQLFYNDVYEVKLPPRHRFPMGKSISMRKLVFHEKIDFS